MSEVAATTHTQRASGWIRPMRPRDPHEAHRAATPLELFFDLVIVVAVARAAAGLHHGIAEGHLASALLAFLTAFFAIWWAWIGFTWFASAYDNDDVPYRITVFVQMIGALVMAAGLGGFEHQDYTLGVLGYVILRLALVVQWLRVAHDDPPCRGTALRYAGGFLLVQALWLLELFISPSVRMPVFFILVLLDLAVPLWAERARPTPWHPHHIAERYSLFTIIVLGETVLSSLVAVEGTLAAGNTFAQIATITFGALITVFSMWWLYFMWPAAHLIHDFFSAFRFGYGHYFIFASVAAVGAGIGVVIDEAIHHAEISNQLASAAFVVPVAVYILSLWALLELPQSRTTLDRIVIPLFALAIVATIWLPQTVLLTGILLVLLVATISWLRPDLRNTSND